MKRKNCTCIGGIVCNAHDKRDKTHEINDRLARVLVKRLLSQKRSLIRAIKGAIFVLEELVPNTSLGEPDEWVVDALKTLKKSLKKNTPKPTLW